MILLLAWQWYRCWRVGWLWYFYNYTSLFLFFVNVPHFHFMKLWPVRSCPELLQLRSKILTTNLCPGFYSRSRKTRGLIRIVFMSESCCLQNSYSVASLLSDVRCLSLCLCMLAHDCHDSCCLIFVGTNNLQVAAKLMLSLTNILA